MVRMVHCPSRWPLVAPPWSRDLKAHADWSKSFARPVASDSVSERLRGQGKERRKEGELPKGKGRKGGSEREGMETRDF